MKLVKDPLLSAANALLVFFIAVLGLVAIAFALGGPASLLFEDRIVAEFAANGVADSAQIFPTLGFALLGLALLLAMGMCFLVLLRRIIKSVGHGDPFVPANAGRLSRMGWIALIAQFAAVPIGASVIWVAKIVADESDKVHMDNDFGFDAGGILLVMILFILARVFRRGAEMREELEGTV